MENNDETRKPKINYMQIISIPTISQLLERLSKEENDGVLYKSKEL
jgi:hypothetical protein